MLSSITRNFERSKPISRLILNLFEFGVHGNGNNSTDSDSDYDQCGCNISPAWYSVMISISHFFLTINRQGHDYLVFFSSRFDNFSICFSSINFLIYCSVGEKFKTIVLRFCRNILATSGRGKKPFRISSGKPDFMKFHYLTSLPLDYQESMKIFRFISKHFYIFIVFTSQFLFYVSKFGLNEDIFS